MNKAFASIKRGLQQAIRHRKGNRVGGLRLPVELYSDKRVEEFDAAEAGLEKLLRRKKKSAR